MLKDTLEEQSRAVDGRMIELDQERRHQVANEMSVVAEKDGVSLRDVIGSSNDSRKQSSRARRWMPGRSALFELSPSGRCEFYEGRLTPPRRSVQGRRPMAGEVKVF